MSSPTPVVGASSQPRITSYITVPMFKSHALRGVPLDQLVPKAFPGDADAAVASYIAQASGWIDSFCQQILQATYDTYVQLVNVNRHGFVRLPARYRPLIAVTAVSLGSVAGQLAALSSLQGAIVTPEFVQVNAGAGGLPINSNQGPLQFGIPAVLPGQTWSQMTYVSGYPVTNLTADVAAGDTTIPVADTTGVIPGNTWLTIQAQANRFVFRAGALSNSTDGSGIASGPGDITCPPLPGDISNKGPYPVQVDGLHEDIIRACVLITRSYIKDNNPAAATGDSTPSSGDDQTEASGILRNFIAPIA